MTKATAGARSAAAAKKKPSVTEAVQMARAVRKRLATMGIHGDAEAPPGIKASQWNRLKIRLTDEIVREVTGEWKDKRQGVIIPDFTPLTPSQVAEPSDVPMWMVRGLWSLGSHGSIAGPKKSLKTTFHDAMALGVASGEKVLGEWGVVEPGPVLIYAGEGSIDFRKRDLQRLANDLYGVQIGDESAPVHVVPVAYPFNTPEFRVGLAKNIKDIEPIMVSLDSTYNYHPRGVNTADMYDRGPLFAELSALVRDSKEDAALILIDHMRQSASLDLDAINMAGVGAWVDSWILAIVDEADPDLGRFKVNMEIGSRRWGGRRRVVDWDLGRFDDSTEEWSNKIVASVSGSDYSSKKKSRSVDKLDQAILQIVKDQEWQHTESALAAEVGGNRPTTIARIKDLLNQRVIVAEPHKGSEGKREVERDRIGFPDRPHLQPTTTSGGAEPRPQGKRGATTTRKKGRG